MELNACFCCVGVLKLRAIIAISIMRTQKISIYIVVHDILCYRCLALHPDWDAVCVWNENSVVINRSEKGAFVRGSQNKHYNRKWPTNKLLGDGESY